MQTSPLFLDPLFLGYGCYPGIALKSFPHILGSLHTPVPLQVALLL